MEDPFMEFADLLKGVVVSRDPVDTTKWKLLGECCMEHAARRAKGSIGEKNIVGVHLYHDEFCWKDYDIGKDTAERRESRTTGPASRRFIF